MRVSSKTPCLRKLDTLRSETSFLYDKNTPCTPKSVKIFHGLKNDCLSMKNLTTRIVKRPFMPLTALKKSCLREGLWRLRKEPSAAFGKENGLNILIVLISIFRKVEIKMNEKTKISSGFLWPALGRKRSRIVES